MDALLTCLQEKDAQDMEEYAFLEDAGEDIGGGLKKSRRNMKRSMLFCLTACALLFVSVAVASRPRGTLQELMTRPDSSQADREVELQVRAQQGDASQEKEITVSVPARELTAADPMGVTVADYTKLGLLEVTRRRAEKLFKDT